MIDWQQIDTVLLDMDGTLLDLHFDNFFWLQHVPKHYAALHKLSMEEAQRKLMDRFTRERGSLNWYCVDYWSEQLQLDISALKLEISHMIAIRPHVTDFLSRLANQKQQLILVTNAHRKSLNIKLACTGIQNWFDDIVVSHDFRAAKEELSFWKQLHTSHPFDRERTLLIDDTEMVLESAQNFGIAHLLTLLQPDSQQAKRSAGKFRGIHHFDEIMPENGNQARNQKTDD